MSIKDFLMYFGTFNICKVNPYYVHTSFQSIFEQRKSSYIKMNVTEQGEYQLSLYQENDRKMKQVYKNYEHSKSRIIVMKLESKGTMSYLTSAQEIASESCSVGISLQPGSYLISAKIAWNSYKSHQGCLTAYGPE
jgi:hypothetical protein